MPDKLAIPDEIELLITDYLNGVISEGETDKLYQWISLSEHHLELFNSYKSIWILSGQSIAITDKSAEIALAKTKKRIGHKNLGGNKSFWTLNKIAASWLIFLILGGALYSWFFKDNTSKIIDISSTTVTSPKGSRTMINLPDGTTVWLNAASKLKYLNSFGHTDREVNLIGEAYFSVKKNKKLPFLVKTQDVVVRALGTKFNVKAYPEEKIVTATLEEGIIEVTSMQNKKADKKVLLRPNEMITYSKETGSKDLASKKTRSDSAQKSQKTYPELILNRNIDTQPITSWKDKTWIINAQPFETLAPILERRYNVKIDFETSDIGKFKFTGKIQDETIDQIINALELTAPVHSKANRNHIILYIDKTRINQFDQYTNN